MDLLLVGGGHAHLGIFNEISAQKKLLIKIQLEIMM